MSEITLYKLNLALHGCLFLYPGAWAAGDCKSEANLDYIGRLSENNRSNNKIPRIGLKRLLRG